jgi:alpha-tubulin suppressor-like RCC1 family protein
MRFTCLRLLPLLLVHCVGDEPGVPALPRPDAGADSGVSDATLAASPLKAVAIASGKTHSCALLASPGPVACWGSNANGELGRIGPASSVPLRVTLAEQAIAVAAGDRFSCATLESGKTFCWGMNESAQSGRLPLGPATSPGAVVEDIAGNANIEYVRSWSNSQRLLAGGEHACAVSSLGPITGYDRDVSVAYCWGKNGSCQLGRRSRPYSDKGLVPTLLADEGTAGMKLSASTSRADWRLAQSFLV